MMRGFPGIAEQDAAMRRHWPAFRIRRLDDRTAIWSGPLRPFMATYEVEVAYRVPLVVERLDPLRQQPRIRVVSPALRPRTGDPEGRLPHVYWSSEGEPSLCLFDFETTEWTPGEFLALTTLPWSVDWLGCYEGWRATGDWTGGGRHVEPARAEA